MSSTEQAGADVLQPPTGEGRTYGRSLGNAAGLIGSGLRALVLPVAFALLLLAIWEILSREGVIDPIIVPAPSEIFDSLGQLLTADYLMRHLLSTLWATLAGFALGSLGAFLIGSVAVLWPPVGRAVYPLVVAMQMLPKVALAPVFIAWLGFGFVPKVVMAASICFFPVLVNTIVGLTTVEDDQVLLLRSLRAKRWREFWELRLPSAAPEIFAGLKAAISFALIGAIVMELIGTRNGLGTLIARFSYSLDMGLVFAVLLLLSVMGLVLYGAVELIDRKVVFWTGEGRNKARATE
jgi:NitT/TauT family transport system permease protein